MTDAFLRAPSIDVVFQVCQSIFYYKRFHERLIVG